MRELLLPPRMNKALVYQQLEIVKADAELVEKDAESAELELQARAWCRCAALIVARSANKRRETVDWVAQKFGLLQPTSIAALRPSSQATPILPCFQCRSW
jgi:hypothetical protein